MTSNVTEIFYDISHLLQSIQARCENRRIFILTDENVSSTCLSPMLEALNAIGEIDVIELEAGESSKSLAICEHLWNHLIENNCSKSDIILNLGGGVITDIGGFVASNFKRGIPFIHVPTSLMAMTDAAIGGKSGIDHLHVKNVIGTFASPEAILVCTSFLHTLPEQELKSGFAEMLKHALIKNQTLWNALIELKTLNAENIILHLGDSIAIKTKIIQEDFHEKGPRKLLNFGHTLGHALESSFLQDEKSITHGEAVALGMMIETSLAHRIGLSQKENSDEIIQGISQFYSLNRQILPNFDRLIPFINNDKKNEGKRILFSLVVKPGVSEYNIEVSPDIIEETYNSIRSAC